MRIIRVKAAALAAAVVAGISLSGCASNKAPMVKDLPPKHQSDPYEAGLVSAVGDISSALKVLAETKNAQTMMVMDPRRRDQVVWQSNFTPPGMDIPITLDWIGPVDPVVQLVADAAEYDYRIIGKRPVPDHFIRMRHEQATAVDVLRDAGVQVGSYAELVIFPSTRMIELRYFADQPAPRAGLARE